RCQVIMATHSPMLMAYPGGRLLRLTKYGLDEATLETTDHYRLMREFCADPRGFVEAGLGGEGGMSLAEEVIRMCTDGQALSAVLSADLTRRVESEYEWDRESFEDYVARIRACPVGLRAMAAVHPLDVSMTLDDLGWHFANWHYRPHCEETLRGLRELEIP